MPEPLSAPPERRPLRQRLLASREAFVADAQAPAATEALARHLAGVLAALEPACLGVYWPVRSEFNPLLALGAGTGLHDITLALPYCRRAPREMHYRRWDRQPPQGFDECSIPSPEGGPVRPDVVLAPCVGFTREGYRLGYGGGYFDRYLAADPAVTAIGVAWACTEIEPGAYRPDTHDVPLMLIVTEQGVLGG